MNKKSQWIAVSVCLSALCLPSCSDDSAADGDGSNVACTAADNKCIDANVAQICENGALYREKCANGCAAGACSERPKCAETDNACKDETTLLICDADSGIMKERECQDGCVGNACASGACSASDNRCIDATTVQICENDTLYREKCAYGCAAGACSEPKKCTIPDNACKDETTLLICDADTGFLKERECENGCVGNACVSGACSADDNKCIDATTVQICENGALYREKCIAGCAAGACREPQKCTVADIACKDETTLLICDANTGFLKERECENGCVGNACASGACSSSDNKCIDADTAQTCENNTLYREKCAAGCADGVCREPQKCAVADNACKDETTLLICDADTGFFKERECANGCAGNACASGACADGDNKCIDANTAQICEAGILYREKCSNGCVGNVCAAPACTAADNKCIDANTAQVCENGIMATKICSDLGESYACDTSYNIADCRETGVEIDLETIDSDGDTIPDLYEGMGDADGDGIPNYLDTDSDGNGIPDMYEGCPLAGFEYVGDASNKKDKNNPAHRCTAPVDTDGDTVPDYLDLDNDGDTIADNIEIRGQSLAGHADDGTFSGNCAGGNAIGTAANPVDCDGDTVPDYMSPDADGDTIPDAAEAFFFKDDVYARYALDADGDTIPDSVEGQPIANGKLPDSDGDGIPDIISLDSDGDGLSDAIEYKLEADHPICQGLNLRLNKDSDGDGDPDGAEYIMALSSYGRFSPAEMICSKDNVIKDIYDFYFVLPLNATDSGIATFAPKVTKQDIVFNIAGGYAMSGAIGVIQSSLNSMMTKIRSVAKDSGIAVSRFDEFPIKACLDKSDYICGKSESNHLPLVVAGQVSADDDKIKEYLTLNKGVVVPGAESGNEALYQLMTREGVKWRESTDSTAWTSLEFPAIDADRWGGAGFRKDTLPVIVYISEYWSHDIKSAYNSSPIDNLAYRDGYIDKPHYTEQVVPKFKSTGTRVITLNMGRGNEYNQMTAWSRESNAVVPVCAFKTSASAWKCGENKCCLGTSGTTPATVNGVADQCILNYTAAYSAVPEYIAQGVELLAKYGTFEVTAKVRGEAMDNGNDTSCFIDYVEAYEYVAPPAEPEASCNPTAIPAMIQSSAYNDGFTNFAPGATGMKDGANLRFNVHAKNDGCYVPGKETKSFSVYIDVYDPTTGIVFDTQKTSIIVPGKL